MIRAFVWIYIHFCMSAESLFFIRGGSACDVPQQGWLLYLKCGPLFKKPSPLRGTHGKLVPKGFKIVMTDSRLATLNICAPLGP
ncbi:hypothetical protein EDB89DRAFT_1965320 [Lactarius sanguifluus]|nr:hypothetical protein EDB89DRAFT_1965320 [Lactarius sanguifluus]